MNRYHIKGMESLDVHLWCRYYMGNWYKKDYTADSLTSRNEEVDRLGNKTAYEYDASGRTTKVTGKKADGTELANVSYAYDFFDNMTEITRGDGMKYALAYNSFHNLESIGVHGKTDKLIKYDYKNGNGRLKQITYANGDIMKATYNSIGQMVAEKWYNAANTLSFRLTNVRFESGIKKATQKASLLSALPFAFADAYSVVFE